VDKCVRMDFLVERERERGERCCEHTSANAIQERDRVAEYKYRDNDRQHVLEIASHSDRQCIGALSLKTSNQRHAFIHTHIHNHSKNMVDGFCSAASVLIDIDRTLFFSQDTYTVRHMH
jgi:hypothetical protein